MANSSLGQRRIPDGWRALGAVALGWMLLAGFDDRWPRRADRAFEEALRHGSLHGHPYVEAWLRGGVHLVHSLATRMPTFWLLVGATLAIPLALLARMVARARVRAGFTDAIGTARGWMAAHPRVAREVAALPGFVWLLGRCREWLHAVMWNHVGLELAMNLAIDACASAVIAFGIARVARLGLRAALAESPVGQTTHDERVADRTRFDAVAVTVETRGAVLAMALLPVLTVLTIQVGDLHTEAASALLGTYVAFAAWGAYAFRRASKVTVGVDGIFVTGSSRTRFLSYRKVDEARVTGSDLELRFRGESVLRLQLHGEDARHRDEILARLRVAIGEARAGATDAVGHVVATTSDSELARLASGGGNYRAPALTREQLWGVVEGSEHDAAAREQAARALATTHRGEDLVRLRVAAEHCAEPRTRARLEDLAEEGDEVEDERPARLVRHAR